MFQQNIIKPFVSEIPELTKLNSDDLVLKSKNGRYLPMTN